MLTVEYSAAASVPDGGSTIALLGMAFTGMTWMRRKLNELRSPRTVHPVSAPPEHLPGWGVVLLMEPRPEEYEHLAKLLHEVDPVSVRHAPSTSCPLDVPISPLTSLFLERVALKHSVDPPLLAGFLLDSLVADAACMRHLLKPPRARA